MTQFLPVFRVKRLSTAGLSVSVVVEVLSDGAERVPAEGPSPARLVVLAMVGRGRGLFAQTNLAFCLGGGGG